MSTFTVRYLAMDGEVRRLEVEAENEDEARDKAWEEDVKHGYCSDSISKIIDVS